MFQQGDMFEGGGARDALRYPNQAGHRGIDTSIEAAEVISKKADSIRNDVLKALRECGRPMTSHELAAYIGEDYANVQPRLSELRAKGLAVDTGLRGKTPNGKSCIKWGVKNEQ